MFRWLNLLVVLCSCLCGCQSVPSFARWRGHSERRVIDDRTMNDLSMDDLCAIEQELFIEASQGKIGVDFDFNVEDRSRAPGGSYAKLSDEARNELNRIDRHFLQGQIVAAARGSQVGLCDESGGRYSGTVLRTGPDHIEMMNCLSQEVIPGPDGQQQCKTSHIPFLTVETQAVTHFVPIAPPPSDFPATDEEIDGSEYSVAEIVNRSGQRQRWGRAPESAPSDDAEGIATVR